MSISMTLLSTFGKPVADQLIKGLTAQRSGAAKLERASAAMAQGLSAVEALKKAFGKDFFVALNEALGTTSNSHFTYEAGTQSYIRLFDGAAAPVQILRDELNINLDRLSALKVQSVELRSHFMGLQATWQTRCLQFYGETTHAEDIKKTFSIIQKLLKGESKNYKEIYQLLSKTGLGGAGALMVISGALIATGTGMGLTTAISLFVFGIPWVTVGALILPGALFMLLAFRKPRPVDDISLSIAMSYKLLERIGRA
jgi:hypothetical protein